MSEQDIDQKNEEVKDPVNTPNYEINGSMFKVAQEGEDEIFILPPDTLPKVQTFLNSLVLSQLNSEEIVDWANTLKNSVAVCVVKDAFSGIADDKKRFWTNALKFNEERLSAASPRYRVENDAIIKGKAAVKRVHSIVNGGADIQVPLYSSGFWITIEPPTEQDWIDFYNKVAEAKISLGRATNGAILSNLGVILNEELCELLARKIVNTTAPADGDLFDKISQLDLFTIAWSLACCVNPTGFNYSRPVLPDLSPEGEDAPTPVFNIVRERLDLRKTFFVDRNALTEDQLKHLTLRNVAAMTQESIDTYMTAFKHNKKAVVIGDLQFNLRVPSINQHLNYGRDWVFTLTDTLDRTLTEDVTDKERNARLTDYARTTTLRQYGHWIESIVLVENNNLIEDQDTINDTLAVLSANTDVRTKLMAEVAKYIEETTVSIVAVTSMNEAEDSLAKGNFPRLIPIDPINTFFTLLAQKIQSIRQRN